MTLDDRDKGRLLVVAILTLLTLPTIWLVNRQHEDSARPNVAAVGVDPGSADPAPAAPVVATFDPLGPGGDGYLTQVTAVVSTAPISVVHGTTPDRVIATATASYKNSIGSSVCQYNGVPGGQRITVVNVANSRSIECTTTVASGLDSGRVVMSTSKFEQIADLVAAPIHVEIRQK